MNFNSTVKGSALEGFYPAGWDFDKIDACIDAPEKVTERQAHWNPAFHPVMCDSLGEFETYMGHEIAMQIKLAKDAGEKIAFILPVGPMGMYKWVVYFLKEWKISCEHVYTFNMDELFNGYAHLHYLSELTSATAQTDSFLMITNETTHTGETVSFYDLLGLEPMSYKNSKGYDVNTIALCALAEWFNYLKQNEVYDNTRIVVVSDHGMGRSSEALIPFQEAFLAHGKNKAMYNSLLLYKDFYSAGEIQTDMTFMTTADVPTLVLEGIVESPINPFTSNLVDNVSKESGVFVSTDNLFMPYHSKSEYIFTVPDDSWYHVKDNIFIDSNWTQEAPR